MRVIRAGDQKRMPWKNGGGVTSEVLIFPEVPDASGRFLYRISIADVASNGPFSRFDGYDRHIMLLDGAGMTLDCREHGRIALERFEPRTFSGDWDVAGTLANGPVRDFNLIVDRARMSADLRVRDVEGTTILDSAGTAVAHVLSGVLDGAAAGDTIIAADGKLTVHGTAKLALMDIALK